MTSHENRGRVHYKFSPFYYVCAGLSKKEERKLFNGTMFLLKHKNYENVWLCKWENVQQQVYKEHDRSHRRLELKNQSSITVDNK